MEKKKNLAEENLIFIVLYVSRICYICVGHAICKVCQDRIAFLSSEYFSNLKEW